MATYRRSAYQEQINTWAQTYTADTAKKSNYDNAEVVRFHANSTRELIQRFPATSDVARYDARITHSQIRELSQGRLDLANKANQLLEAFNEQILVPKREWQSDVAGFFPNVPAYLSNEPENMWRIENEPSDRTPLRIWIGVTSSDGVGESELMARGAALAAFGLALSNTRTVYLTPYVNLGSEVDRYSKRSSSAIISWDLATSPLVLSEVGACLASPEVVRNFGLAACFTLNPKVTGNWCAGYTDEDYMRSILGAAPDDIYLPSIVLGDPLLKNPIEWIKTNLAHLLNEGELDED